MHPSRKTFCLVSPLFLYLNSILLVLWNLSVNENLITVVYAAPVVAECVTVVFVVVPFLPFLVQIIRVHRLNFVPEFAAKAGF